MSKHDKYHCTFRVDDPVQQFFNVIQAEANKQFSARASLQVNYKKPYTIIECSAADASAFKAVTSAVQKICTIYEGMQKWNQ